MARAVCGPVRCGVGRVEQLFPFPKAEVLLEIRRYMPGGGGSGGVEVVWCQEEPRNCGAYRHVRDCLLFGDGGSGDGSLVAADAGGTADVDAAVAVQAAVRGMRYVGRAECSSAAGGVVKWHREEQAEIVRAALAASSS